MTKKELSELLEAKGMILALTREYTRASYVWTTKFWAVPRWAFFDTEIDWDTTERAVCLASVVAGQKPNWAAMAKSLP